MKRPEILAPCGNFEKMRFAVLYGADAVYLAGKSFGMRTASDNFTDEELKSAIDFAHERGVKVYITVNVMPRQYELDAFEKYLSYLSQIKPDALIVADLGVMSLAKKHAPGIDIHISTQANTVNSLSCRVFHELGAKRVVLSRELSLDEIKRIRDDIPDDLELEAFVHGAMCVSHSGRCLLSNFFVGRDANHGACAQPCRWEYNGEGLSAEITEVKRPDIRLTALENERGTFIFSSKDMCMIEHIPELVKAGIDSFKIEGRVKSAYYTAVTANSYKTELMKYLADPDGYIFDGAALRELESVSHREYCTGYYFDHPLTNAQITQNGGYIKEKAFLATVESFDPATMRATLIQRNKAVNGNEADIITPGGMAKSFVLCDMQNEAGEPIESAPHPQMRFSVKMPFEVNIGDIIRGK
ncbi:MAG: U32 family peptidase [Ruminococcaceae bacterium]|nr:U32 family peptidase [Oscillospiraceae bacterium]